MSQFHAEQARGHERQSLDWCTTLEKAQQLAVVSSDFYTGGALAFRHQVADC